MSIREHGGASDENIFMTSDSLQNSMVLFESLQSDHRIARYTDWKKVTREENHGHVGTNAGIGLTPGAAVGTTLLFRSFVNVRGMHT